MFINQERNRTFQLCKAQVFRLIEGPLYGKLKQGAILLLPDGFIINGASFASIRYTGIKISFLINGYNNRPSIEVGTQADMLYFLYY